MNKAAKTTAIRLPQFRVLRALTAKGRPTMTRAELARKAGFNPTSGTINRALHGIAKGSSSGDPYPGLLTAGLVEAIPVELDGGVTETRYRATATGAKAAKTYAKANGKARKVRNAAKATNARYQIN